MRDNESPYTLVILVGYFSLFILSKIINANYLINEASYKKIKVSHVVYQDK